MAISVVNPSTGELSQLVTPLPVPADQWLIVTCPPAGEAP